MNPMKTSRDDMAGLVHHNERTGFDRSQECSDARSPARGNRAGKGLEAVNSGSPFENIPHEADIRANENA